MKQLRKDRGFTLVELIMLLVLVSILASIALPKFINIATDSRIAAVNSLAGTLRTTATTVRLLCIANAAASGCDVNSATWIGTINGVTYRLNYGYPDAGDNLNSNQIDSMINYSGFTASIPALAYTLFTKDGAPTPANCSVRYNDAYYGSGQINVTVTTTGC